MIRILFIIILSPLNPLCFLRSGTIRFNLLRYIFGRVLVLLYYNKVVLHPFEPYPLGYYSPLSLLDP